MICHRFPDLGKWQAIGLAMMSMGIVRSQRSCLSKIAEHLLDMGKPDSVERRLQRWVSNGRIEMRVCWDAWIKWVVASFDDQRLVLLVDETKLGSHLGVMMVGLAYQTRCIPLIWRCYRPEAYPEEGQVALIKTLLLQVKRNLPEAMRPLVQADRGIGTSPALIRVIADDLQWRYLFRVQNHTKVITAKGQARALHTLVKPGEHWRGYGVVFKQRGRIPAHVRVIWQGGQRQPWCLVTNDPLLFGTGYAMRVWQEESFRDLKSGGWQWQRSRVWHPDHADRLILALALAYAWVLTQGTLLLGADPHTRHQVTRGRKRRYSIFREGLRYVQRLWYDHKPVYLGLFFAPDKLLC